MPAASNLWSYLDIVKPTVIVDKKRVMRNIEKMAQKAHSSGVRFRPHFKTHQSAEIGNWFRDFGVTAITVSSLDMAQYFAKHGWNDITVAFLVNVREIDKIRHLASQIQLHLLVDSESVLFFLKKNLKHHVHVWIKLDVGYGRTGMHWSSLEQILSLAHKINDSQKFTFSGLLTHSGNTYQAKSIAEILQIHRQAVDRLITLQDMFHRHGFSICEISIGDTPSCSVVNNFQGVDEIRPGNFVFNDLIQLELGTCTEDEIAVAVACPVVGKYKERRQVVIYGGAVHLSKEYIIDERGRKIFGYATTVKNQALGKLNKQGPIISLTQEHGVLQVDGDLFHNIEIGDLLFIVPVHSCLTCDLYGEYRTLEGERLSRIFKSIERASVLV